jgi:hypothetical protein
MNFFLIPAKSAIPDSTGDRITMTKKENEIAYVYKTEFLIEIPKKSTISPPKASRVVAL